jgi:1-acyl-sn-glycerol-3-phosphate acyltransferase
VQGLPDPIAARSELLFRLFVFYLRWSAGRRFRAIRVSGADPARLPLLFPADRPLIVYGNHPSWWDPAVYLLLADLRFRGRPGFGPMDQVSLGRYGFFRRLGVFGIDKHGASGARRFLSVARAVLNGCAGPNGRAMLWVTAEGDFTDPRARPLRLRPGIAHLAALVPNALMVPVALEYVFWNESRPELLIRFGQPIDCGVARRAADWGPRLEQALTDTMDALAVDALAREPARFTRLVAGRAGVGGVYDGWRWAKARLSGRRFVAAHGDEA